MSVADIFDVMESHRRRRDDHFKRLLTVAFTQAQSTAEHIGRYLNKDNKARAPWDFFPALFQVEKELYEKEEAERQMVKARENRKKYAAEVKRRREAGIM